MRISHVKLFVPGPIEVRPEVLQAMATPQIYHRTPEFRQLYSDLQTKLRKFLYTEQPVLLFASSSTGAMEAAVRNCVGKRVLHVVNGAFAKRWYEISQACGIPADALEIPWEKAARPAEIAARLKGGQYDAVAVVYNETSTGLMNPLPEIAAAVREFPDVLLLVDAVTAMGGVKIEFDKLGLDVCLAGVQKCFGLPPGLTVCAVSERAIRRAEAVKPKTYYFSFPVMLKSHEKNETPATPSVPHLFALNVQLEYFFEEGLERRFARHAEMAAVVQAWAKKHFDVYPEEGYWSKTVTCIKNTRGISVDALNKTLIAQYGLRISNGYGDLREKTFRIAHMGDLTLPDVRGVLAAIEEVLKL
ncbi:MAG: alanine--glyoxylate aminotransferase family protein [Candidatus Bipolaricaulota bacterium]|nr:alanine--glyoxylate aminotransferase family protein [Candidatus Bipolaricaulota bacterium]